MADLNEILTGKITSEATLEGYTQSKKRLVNHTGDSYFTPWWLQREFLRMERGIYPPSTEIIDFFSSKIPQFALHVSKEDPNYIAYTPDRVSGEADRQLKTTLGKFIIKYYPHYPDQTVSDIVAQHLAEATGVLEILRGQALVDFYKNPKAGLSSCMAKSTSYFNDLNKYHPAEVYDMPHIGLAISRSSSGEINGRCLVYEASATDKRWIRLYGDGKLVKLLERNGYRRGNWISAEFKQIPLPQHDASKQKAFLMPYLDGDGQAGSESRSTIMLFNDKLLCVDRVKFRAVMLAAGSTTYTVAIHTAGYIRVAPSNSESTKVICAVSGVSIDTMTEEVYEYWLDGKIVKVCTAVYDAGKLIWVKKSLVSSSYGYKAPVDTVTFLNRRNETVLDTQEQRVWSGYKRLDAIYYPDEQDWISLGSWGDLADGYVEGLTGVIKQADAVRVISDNQIKYAHQQTIGVGYVKVHSITRGEDIYAGPEIAVYKTATGRKVVPGVHSVAETIDGVWEFTRNVVKDYVFGKTIWRRRDQTAGLTYEQFTKLFDLDASEQNKLGNSPAELGVFLVRKRLSEYITVRDRHLHRHANTDIRLPWAEVSEATKLWLRDYTIATDIVTYFGYLDYWVTTYEAEAGAIDYNHQHTAAETVTPPPVVGVTVSAY